MNFDDRISRKQRLRTLKSYKTWVALGLAIVLLLLVIVKRYGSEIPEFLNSSPIQEIFQKGDSDDIDSLVFRAGHSFDLNNPVRRDSVEIRSNGIKTIRFTQTWPNDLPLIFYARRIQDLSEKAGLKYDFVQFGKDSLICELSSRENSQAKIVVKPDKKTVMENRFLGVILKNIYELNDEQITSIVRSRIPFGYLAEADVFPAGEIKRRLQSRWASSIIKISVSKEDLAKYNIRDNNDLSTYRDLASDFLGRHPNPAILDLERSESVDLIFAEALIDQARKRDMQFLFLSGSTDGIDSLAFSAGLTFVTYHQIMDYLESNINEIQTDLVTELVLSKKAAKAIALVDTSKIRPEDFVEMMKRLRKIGINILYFNKLSDHEEFTIEDL